MNHKFIGISLCLLASSCESSSDPKEVTGGTKLIDLQDSGVTAVDGGLASNIKPETDAGKNPNCKEDIVVKMSNEWKADSALCFAVYFPYTTFNCLYDSARDETACTSDGGGVDYLVQWLDDEVFITTHGNKYLGRISRLNDTMYNIEAELHTGTELAVCTISDNRIEVCKRD